MESSFRIQGTVVEGHHLRRANVSSWPFSKLVHGEETMPQHLLADFSRRHRQEPPGDPQARAFLLKTQKPDDSWTMTSRAFNSGDYKKGSDNLEPITVAGSAWAVLGLLQLTSGTR